MPKAKKMTLAAFQIYCEVKPKYVISFFARYGTKGSHFSIKRLYVANGVRPSSVTFVSSEKEACYFQYSKEIIGIFASMTAGNYCDIIEAKECTTPANTSLIENESFEEEVFISRRNKASCPTYFSGGHSFKS